MSYFTSLGYTSSEEMQAYVDLCSNPFVADVKGLTKSRCVEIIKEKGYSKDLLNASHINRIKFKYNEAIDNYNKAIASGNNESAKMFLLGMDRYLYDLQKYQNIDIDIKRK